jgi:prevent-host-death family protein
MTGVTTSERVGVRELRQNLSVYLARVQQGESLRVTEHGRVVALLVPLPAGTLMIDALVASGRAAAPEGDLTSLGRPGRSPRSLSRALDELRGEERGGTSAPSTWTRRRW